MLQKTSDNKLAKYFGRLRRPWVIGISTALILLAVTIYFSAGSGWPGSQSWRLKTGGSETNGSNTSATGDTIDGEGFSESQPQTERENSAGKATSPNPSPSNSLPPNYASGTYSYISPDDPTPKNCTLERGSVCTFLWRGIYQLSAFDFARLQVAAFENDKTEPSATAEVTIKKGLWRWFNRLTYTVSADAEHVRFVVTVIGSNGSILYRTDPPPPAIPIPH